MKKDTRTFLLTMFSIPALLVSASFAHGAWAEAHSLAEADAEEVVVPIELIEEEPAVVVEAPVSPPTPVPVKQAPTPPPAAIPVNPPQPNPTPAPVVAKPKPAPAPRPVVVKKSRTTRAS